MNNPSWILLALTLLCGCGLGTEVGNGKKPKTEQPAPDKAAKEPAKETENTEDPDSPDESEESSSGKSKSKSASDDDSGTDAGDTVTGGEAPDSESMGSGSQAPLPTAGDNLSTSVDFATMPLLKLLTANCASPFGDNAANFDANYTVVSADANSGALVSTSKDSSGMWTLSTGDGEPLALLTPAATSTTPYRVTARAADDSPLGTSYSCTSVRTDAGVHIPSYTDELTRITVSLSDGSQNFQMTWYRDQQQKVIRMSLIGLSDSTTLTLDHKN